MNLSKVFQNVDRLYVDTSPFIYYIEENPAYIDKMDQIFSIIKTGKIQGICSVVTLTEVLPIPLRTDNKAIVKAYRDILLNSREFACIPLTEEIAIQGAKLRALYNLKTPDALHLATAIEQQCDSFLTNDIRLKQVSRLNVLVLNELVPDGSA